MIQSANTLCELQALLNRGHIIRTPNKGYLKCAEKCSSAVFTAINAKLQPGKQIYRTILSLNTMDIQHSTFFFFGIVQSVFFLGFGVFG